MKSLRLIFRRFRNTTLWTIIFINKDFLWFGYKKKVFPICYQTHILIQIEFDMCRTIIRVDVLWITSHRNKFYCPIKNGTWKYCFWWKFTISLFRITYSNVKHCGNRCPLFWIKDQTDFYFSLGKQVMSTLNCDKKTFQSHWNEIRIFFEYIDPF